MATEKGRLTPQDLEAERSLLGAILLEEGTGQKAGSFPDILEKLSSKDFYDKKHAAIYQAMTTLYEHGQPIDLLTLTSELRAQKMLKEVGGSPYLAELTNVVPTASHIMSYADLVEQASVRRRLIKAGTSIVDGAYDGGKNVQDLLGKAEKDLFEVSDKTIKSDYTPMSELLVDAFERMENLHKNKGALRGLKTGYPDIDKKTAGFQKGDLIILGARPAMGKTTLAQNLAYNIADINKKGVLFFSLEMSKNQIIDRMISPISGVDSWKIRNGNISDEDFSKIGDALGVMSEVPIYIDDTGGMTTLEIRNKARRAMHDHDLGIVIIDYLSLIKGSDYYRGNRVQEVTEISRDLKMLAREMDIPVIALAQLNRQVTGRDDPRPVLSDLRESGSIEQDADLVMFLHRPDYYHREEGYEKTNITELNIEKHRNGPLGRIKLFFDDSHDQFLSLEEERSEDD